MKKKAPKVSYYSRERSGRVEHYATWRIPKPRQAGEEPSYVRIWHPLDFEGMPNKLTIANAIAKVQSMLNSGIDPRAGTVDIDGWLDAFEEWLLGRRAKNTVEVTMRPLRAWRAWLREKHPTLTSPRDLTYHEHIEKYESFLLASPKLVPAKGVHNVKGATQTHVPDPSGALKSKRTVNIEMQALRAICTWSLESDEKGNSRGYLVSDPTAPRKRQKEPAAETVALELSTAQKVEALIGNGVRDSAIVHARVHRIMIETGRRTHELFGCKRGDLQPEAARLRYRDKKTGKAKYCDLSPRAVAWLSEWSKRPGDDEALIPVSRSAFVSRLARACKKLKIRRYGPHTLRHTHGTWLLDKGANLRDVQVSLDHARIETTTRYTHVSRGRLTQVVASLHGLVVDEVVDKGKVETLTPRKRKRK